MSSGKERLEAALYNAADDQRMLLVNYPPPLNEFTVTKAELLSLHPAPLPVPLPEPPPLPPPTPVPVVDTLVVDATLGLRIRGTPSPTGVLKGVVAYQSTVEVQGHYPSGDYDYGQLMRVDGLKYADVGFIARSKAGEIYLTPKAPAR